MSRMTEVNGTGCQTDCVRNRACADCGGGWNRRHFLMATAAFGAASFLAPPWGWADESDAVPPLPPYPKVKLYVFYSGGAGAWPKPEFDAPAARAKYDAYIGQLAARFPDVEFTGRQELKKGDESVQLIKQSGAQGILCIKIGPSMPTWSLAADLPLAIYDAPFSIHEWILIQEQRRDGKPIVHLPSRDLKEIDFAVSLLKTAAQMRQSKILLVSAQPGKRQETIKNKFGCEVIPITTQEAVEAHQKVDAKLGEDLAEKLFLKTARKIVEPSREEIIKSAKMYVAMRQMLAQRQAHAIAINCLGGIPIKILGYPCLGFAQLLDEGRPGVCEADLDSALTMLMFQYAVNKPGFITDPLFDLSKNAVIHAHCVAPRRMDGPEGEPHPYNIRTHRDDNRGASAEVDLRVGQKITCAKVINDDAILISTGKIIEGKVPEFDDAGCRTQITVEVDGSAENMLENFSKDITHSRDMRTLLHRVVFYGDHTRMIHHLSQLMQFKVIPEC
ncbi:MAG: hypothetical protein NTX50_32305 [Candidatus Sumerlaeota bacterium]|nr:hypothetical protein [Candidatus Sumerlaeota bacterium]